jgi:hypothetical protein
MSRLGRSAHGPWLEVDGRPWFLLADTAWDLINRYRIPEAEHLLAVRAAQGFTAVLAVVLGERDNLCTANAEGHVSLQDLDPARPSPGLLEHIDQLVDAAERQGLWLGLVPAWGDKWNRLWGGGPEVLDPDNARILARIVADRWRGRQVFWVVGGDRNPDTPRHHAILDALAGGIRDAVGDHHLIAVHPQGMSCSTWHCADREWVDLHLAQSGHKLMRPPAWTFIEQMRAAAPGRPVADGEPPYEDHPRMSPDWRTREGWYSDLEIRAAAWQAVFSGACGHVYGCHSVWQRWDEAFPPINAPRTPWREALHLPVAGQLQHLRTLVEEFGIDRLVPDQELLARHLRGGPIRACRDRDRRWAMVYHLSDFPLDLDLQQLAPTVNQAIWLDPRDGTRTVAIDLELQPRCAPPNIAHDWVLILTEKQA